MKEITRDYFPYLCWEVVRSRVGQTHRVVVRWGCSRNVWPPFLYDSYKLQKQCKGQRPGIGLAEGHMLFSEAVSSTRRGSSEVQCGTDVYGPRNTKVRSGDAVKLRPFSETGQGYLVVFCLERSRDYGRLLTTIEGWTIESRSMARPVKIEDLYAHREFCYSIYFTP
jgi:hypothetical protein